jgi:antagonist of KipI
MSAETLEILDPGILTTVQDQGRTGFQRYGVPVSGALDTYALQVANIMVGNDESQAGLEITVLGPRVRFLADTRIALTGADLTPLLDGEPIPPWQAVEARSGSVLAFGGVRDGARAYMAVAGGIDVPVVMGSRSTYVTGAIGGLEGRALRSGDVLATLPVDSNGQKIENRLPDHLAVPYYGHEQEIRVVLGPQDGAFTAQGIATFLGSEYAVSMDSDRMGCRLDGPKVEHVSGPDIVSDGTALGAVQIPGDGKPIVLLADRGTTGGYTKIATVISADIGNLVQAMPGDTVSFSAVSVDEAHAILRQRRGILRDIRKVAGVDAGLSIVVDGELFEVTDEAGKTMAWTEPPGEESSTAAGSAKATVDGRTYEFDVEVRRTE